MSNNTIQHRVCIKKLVRGEMSASRIFIQWNDGKQKWRTYLPFYISSITSREAKVLIHKANLIAQKQRTDYQSQKNFFENLCPKVTTDVSQIAPD